MIFFSSPRPPNRSMQHHSHTLTHTHAITGAITLHIPIGRQASRSILMIVLCASSSFFCSRSWRLLPSGRLVGDRLASPREAGCFFFFSVLFLWLCAAIHHERNKSVEIFHSGSLFAVRTHFSHIYYYTTHTSAPSFRPPSPAQLHSFPIRPPPRIDVSLCTV